MNATYTDDQLVDAVKNNKSIAGTLIDLGLKPAGGNYKTIRNKIKNLGINISHFTGQAHAKGTKKNNVKKRPLVEILVKDSDCLNTSYLRKRLIKEKILHNKCYVCGISEWLNKKIVCQLDHINGNNIDNRKENLRLLCPNCHSQTETYAGKNKKGKYLTQKCDSCDVLIRKDRKFCKQCFKKNQYSGNLYKKISRSNCVICNKQTYRNNKRCKSCAAFESRKTKIEWPSTLDLINMINETSYLAVARKLGVSDNAVRKRIKNHKAV